MIVFQVFQVRTGSVLFMARVNPLLRGMAYGAITVGIIIFSQRVITRFIYQGF